MEIEHINDDTIRVKIENSDLTDRGVTFLDLLGNQNQIEKFFYSILEEVDIDDEFKDSEAVTFQVMPKNNGLELFISKGTQVNEQMFEELDYNQESDYTKKLNFLESAPNKQSSSTNHEATNYDLSDEELADHVLPNYKSILLVFNNIEQTIMMANEYTIENGSSTLYSLEDHFYLNLVFYIEDFVGNDEEFAHFKENEIAHALEFGNKSNVSSDVIEEHGELIIQGNALDILKKAFK